MRGSIKRSRLVIVPPKKQVFRSMDNQFIWVTKQFLVLPLGIFAGANILAF
jgi:hypothetical protein